MATQNLRLIGKIYLLGMLVFLICCQGETHKILKSEKERLQKAYSLFNTGKLEDAAKKYIAVASSLLAD